MLSSGEYVKSYRFANIVLKRGRNIKYFGAISLFLEFLQFRHYGTQQAICRWIANEMGFPTIWQLWLIGSVV